VDKRTHIPSCSSPGYGAAASASTRTRRTAARTAAATAAVLAGAALFSFSKPAAANQHWNLWEGLPTVIEDAFTRGPGSEAQAYVRWNNYDESRNEFELVPRFVWGFGDQMELRASGRAIAGGPDRTGSGDLRGSLLYRFTEPGTGWDPAWAGMLSLDAPTGRGTRGIDTTIKLIATSTLGPPQAASRVHFNVGYTDNDRPRSGERGSRWLYGVGYSQPVGTEMVLVADLVREEGRLGGQRTTIAEVGVRWPLAPATIASVCVGMASGPGAPDYRLIAGIQIPL
jgi:hypothetical protein